MKAIFILIGVFYLGTVSIQLDYPKNLGEISTTELYRPARKRDGKPSQHKELTTSEIRQLLYILQYAEPVSYPKFKFNYYIVFKTTDNRTVKLAMDNREHVKEENGKQVYKLRTLSWMDEF